MYFHWVHNLVCLYRICPLLLLLLLLSFCLHFPSKLFQQMHFTGNLCEISANIKFSSGPNTFRSNTGIRCYWCGIDRIKKIFFVHTNRANATEVHPKHLLVYRIYTLVVYSMATIVDYATHVPPHRPDQAQTLTTACIWSRLKHIICELIRKMKSNIEFLERYFLCVHTFFLLVRSFVF